MLNTRTRDLALPGQVLYNVECQTCGLGALANLLAEGERFAQHHLALRPDHRVFISGRGVARVEVAAPSGPELATVSLEELTALVASEEVIE